ncbi:MAG: crossover junction endodeoxyribonuclease RuvC [Pontimonas sp.]|nr:crossover junction endodeoxyribonuclease RuvC [Pontimonas sp.]
MTIILGIDPGLTRLGVGVIQHGPGRAVSLVHVDVYRTPAEDEPASRIGSLATQLAHLLDEYSPDVVALERVFAQHNLRTVMGTAQISGVVFALAHARSIPVSLRTPSEVKAAVTGHGRASKSQVGTLVQAILGLDEIPQPADAADALALAITEAWRGVAPIAASGETTLTPAQQAWRAAEAKAKRPRLTE